MSSSPSFQFTQPASGLFTVDPRQILLFGLGSLPTRQELVLKSMMRLLDRQLDHKWLYSPDVVDLWIVADGWLVASPQFSRDATGAPAHVLTLGDHKKDRVDFLTLPLYVDELFLTLNRIGNALQKKKSVATKVQLIEINEPSNTFLRLKRWPPAELLGTLDRVRMATLLTGQPLALQELQRKARLPMAACKTFVNDMFQAGLLGTAETVQPAMSTTTLPVTHTPAVAKQPSALSPIKPGLLDKIRRRLGLGMGAQP